MVSEKLKNLFGKVKKRLSELKPEDVAKFTVKEGAGLLPFVGPIVKDAINELWPDEDEDEKKEIIKELNALSESQFKEISEKVGISVEYLEEIRQITLYFFEELRADHGAILEKEKVIEKRTEKIEGLILHLIEIQTREVKPLEINIPTIQSTLRKGETLEGDFFKKEPEWIDFEDGFVVERNEVDEIIQKLETDDIQLVVGKPASGKSVILKNIGFNLANKNKDVNIVQLKECSLYEVQSYFDVLITVNDEKAVFIVDDAHLLPKECERLI